MSLTRCWGLAENGESVEVAVVPQLFDRVVDLWPPVGLTRFDRPSDRVTARFGLSDTWMIVPDTEASGDNPSQAAWDRLEAELELFSVKRLERLVPVHAAAIAWNGQVVMVPGVSGAGKSTLAFAASKVGAQVLSDEFTLIDPSTGLVTGWPRPVRMKRDGEIQRLHLAEPAEPLPVGLLALVQHNGEVGCDWHDISSADAVIGLLNNALSTRTRPGATMDAAVAVARSARAIAGHRSEAAQAVTELLGLLINGNGSRPS
ncbi:MAG: hypothetical protein KDB34_08325 [Propionibacteriaceae bacterium]|nr:hypothetical protein [Propionibacteriaceae bacterium]MCB1029184.1 hypothetical protein [Microthrixaceae bacterium]